MSGQEEIGMRKTRWMGVIENSVKDSHKLNRAQILQYKGKQSIPKQTEGEREREKLKTFGPLKKKRVTLIICLSL